ncbi:tyrosine-protein phosphatase [Dyadobacter sp. CY345]|uniref:tyrosine-protein phosphatase n=1 Tax=Dyadobacter sp. CY345 TaxID=2909335 RepID=UPI001F3FF1DB|nr:tyrosine-protein phosphatase [Dyadobacter sp. CY345]MCF2445019.1 tyrosine-protein phosphatase [Dyadobacter sp. CY345]
MKTRLLILLFPVLLPACVKLPARYDEKTLKEEYYVENNKNDYVLHYTKTADSQVFLIEQGKQTLLNSKENPLTLTNQAKRPYFKTISGKDTLILSNRRIDFENVINFRDIGGLKTLDGNTVRWGKIFRSDNLADLEPAAFEKFNDLKIRTIFDLRTASEIKGKEDHLPENVSYRHVPCVKDNGDLLTQLRGKLLRGEISEAQSLQMTTELYQNMVTSDLSSLRELLQNILNSDEPVLYHCSAGKDRTGVVTAMILSILHVDRKTIFDEYLMSNYYRRDKLKKILGRAKLGKIIKPKINLKVIENFMSVDERYLAATFSVIDTRYGGTDLFIKNQLGINDQERQRIIKKLTDIN